MKPTRRKFVMGAAAAVTGAALGVRAQSSSAVHVMDWKSPVSLVDVNVNLSRWPLRRLPHDETPVLVEKLRNQNVSQAWAGTFDGLLHKDIATANARLAEECKRYGGGLLVPFGSINPMLPDWEEELRRCAEDYRMPGIRLHPNYHDYTLENAVFLRLLYLASERDLIIQIALVMEDERMMHRLMRVEPVDAAPLADALRRNPRARIVLINALRTLRGNDLKRVLDSGNVSVEISMLEGVGGIERLLEQIPASRLLFGSHAPLFYFESALLKLRESAVQGDDLKAIGNENARRLLARGGDAS